MHPVPFSVVLKIVSYRACSPNRIYINRRWFINYLSVSRATFSIYRKSYFLHASSICKISFDHKSPFFLSSDHWFMLHFNPFRSWPILFIPRIFSQQIHPHPLFVFSAYLHCHILLWYNIGAYFNMQLIPKVKLKNLFTHKISKLRNTLLPII